MRVIVVHLAWLAFASAAVAAVPGSHPVVQAVHRGDCQRAVGLIDPDATRNDADTAFIAGRMLDEGLCVRADAEAARRYYARAADLGSEAAELEYAAKTGLGTGSAQSYEQAGMVCRQAGLDRASQVPTYDLGFTCTVSEVASALLRQSLPRGSFRPNSGMLTVEFVPATRSLRVLSTPVVERGEASLGSNIRAPLVDAEAEVRKAWSRALELAPQPDAARLGTEPIAVSLDVDMTLEVGRPLEHKTGTIFSGDVRREQAH